MLKEKFDGAHEVKQKRRSGRRMLVPKYHRFKHHGDIDLVYLVTSPDYCELDVKKGSLGTKGRECNPVSSTSSHHSHFAHSPFSCRSRKASTGATCCVATVATQRGENVGRRDASASSTGAAMWSAKSAWGTFRSPPAIEQKHDHGLAHMSIQAAAVEYSSRKKNLASSRLSVLPYIVETSPALAA